jgi:hypothetical protein
MTRKTWLFSIFFIFFAGALLAAGEADEAASAGQKNGVSASVLTQNPETVIGFTLPEAFGLLGVPDEVFSHRGEKAEFDDVVFFYKAKSVYLFLFENRVWAVRFDKNRRESFLGIGIGMKKETVMKTLLFPNKELADSTVFFLKDAGYPVRLRLYFENGVLTDAYLYRGDF